MIRATFALVFVLAQVPSGPQVGDALPEAKVKGVYEPIAGKEISLLERGKKEPTLIVFVQKFSRPAFRLLREIDKLAVAEDKLNTNIVWIAEDFEKTEAYLTKARPSLDFKSSVSISVDLKTGPQTYGLNDQIAVTILLAKEGKIVANIALADPNETDARMVGVEIKKLFGK